MNAQELIDPANALVANDKGLLAMDESNPTCNKRLAWAKGLLSMAILLERMTPGGKCEVGRLNLKARAIL